MSGTRQSFSLPGAALGKEKHLAKKALPSASHSAKLDTLQRPFVLRARHLAKLNPWQKDGR